MDNRNIFRRCLSDSAIIVNSKVNDSSIRNDQNIIDNVKRTFEKRSKSKTNFISINNDCRLLPYSNKNCSGGRKKSSNCFSGAASQIKNFLVPDYKTRNEEFKRLFKFDETERFIVDYSCAVQREILAHGRMYISQNWLCFHANIFGWETRLTINFKDILSINKKKTVKFIPNAIQICTSDDHKLFFTSFATRNKTFSILHKIWKSCLGDKKLDFDYIWHWVYDTRERSNSNKKTKLKTVQRETFALTSADSAILDPEPLHLENFNADCKDLVTPYSKENDEAIDKSNLINDCNTLPKIDITLSTPSATISSSSAEQSSSSSDSSNYSDNVFETSCTCESHFGAEMLNEVLPVSMDTLFEMMFTDCSSANKFHTLRAFSNYIYSDWTKTDLGITNESTTNGKTLLATGQNRIVTYSAALNHSIGVKSCKVKERQEVSANKEDQVTIVSECHNVGIPYGDIFDIGLTYCITRVSGHTCRLRGFGGVIYRKNCWGFFKSFLEKNAFSGLEQHFTDLKKHLRSECDLINYGKRTSIDLFHSCTSLYDTLTKTKRIRPKIPRLRRESRRPSNRMQTGNFQNLLVFLIIILVVLLCLNVLLYTNLWLYYAGKMEHSSHEAESTPLPLSNDHNDDQLPYKAKFSQLISKLYRLVEQVEHLLNEMKHRLRV